MAISTKQTGLIHVALKRLGMEDDDYRSLLLRVAGVTSSAELDGEGFGALMDEFRRLGFESTAHRASFGERSGRMATAGQVARIRRLWAASGYDNGDPRKLDAWIAKRFGVASLRFLDFERVNKVIAALTAMAARRQHMEVAS